MSKYRNSYREEGEFWGLTFRSLIMFALGLLLLTAIAGGGRYVYLKVWGVKTADMERQVFEESKSYIHGTIRDLENLRVDYAKASSDSEKEVLKQTILHRVATFNQHELPEDLREFVHTLKGEDQ